MTAVELDFGMQSVLQMGPVLHVCQRNRVVGKVKDLITFP